MLQRRATNRNSVESSSSFSPQGKDKADKVRRLKDKFRTLDASHDGKLDFREMFALLKKGNPTFVERELRSLFDILDANSDGKIDFDEFLDYLYDPQKAEEVAVPDDVPLDVGTVFHKYCKNADGTMMCQKTFTKLCRDCSLMDQKLFTNVDADCLFLQVKPKGVRTINEREFVKALSLVAAKKGVDVQDVYNAVGDCPGPVHNATQGESVRLHDDTSTYTGVRGKMAREKENAGKPPERDLVAEEIEREKRYVRGLERENEERRKEFESQVEADRVAKLLRPPDGERARETPPRSPQTPIRTLVDDDTDWTLVEPAFVVYCGRNGQMEGSEFLKILKDCDLLDPRRFKLCDVDTTFRKVAKRGQNNIGLEQFQDALKIVAEKKEIAPYFVQAAIASRKSGPSMTKTRSTIPGASGGGSMSPPSPGPPSGLARHATYR